MNEIVKQRKNKYLAKVYFDRESNSIKTETVEEHTNELLNRLDFLYLNDYINKEIYDKLKLIALNHDIGKCNNLMNKRLIEASKNKKIKFDETIEVPHNVLSYILLDKNDFDSEEDYIIASYICLNHHHYKDKDNFKYLNDYNELINNAKDEFNLEKLPRRKMQRDMHEYIDDEKVIYLKGLLHKLDYSASSHLPIEIKNDFLITKFNEMLNRKNFKMNELQNYCKNNSDENLIIIAQTGMGKTEAALSWIENNKAFYFLPLRVSINSMYKRIVADIFENKNYSNKIGLLHSDTKNIYNKDINDDDFLTHYKLSKNYSLPLTISTIDQLLNFVYKYSGFEYKLSSLALSKIVIDEVQSYDAKLTASLIKALEMLEPYNVKVNILTATFPPYLKDLYTNNPYYNKGRINKRKFKEEIFINNNLIRHKLKVYKTSINSKDIINKQIKSKGKCLVICNTINQAQKIYSELKEKLSTSNTTIHLLHSNFIGMHRHKLEEEILKCGDTNNQENCIWVTTNLVEASLDIDFDYLFTEMSDLNSLFQRLGRCNRKGLKKVDDYNCFIYLKTNKFLLNMMIDEAIYKLSCEALENFDGILTEENKINLINNYLTTNNLKKYNSKFLKDFEKYYLELDTIVTNEYDKNESQLRDINNKSFIPASIYLEYESDINNWLDKLKKYPYSSKEYLNAKQSLDSLLLSIPLTKNNYLGGTIKTIQISNFEKYDVIDCSYDNEFGFMTKNNFQDNFM